MQSKPSVKECVAAVQRQTEGILSLCGSVNMGASKMFFIGWLQIFSSSSDAVHRCAALKWCLIRQHMCLEYRQLLHHLLSLHTLRLLGIKLSAGATRWGFRVLVESRLDAALLMLVIWHQYRQLFFDALYNYDSCRFLTWCCLIPKRKIFCMVFVLW